MGFRGTEFLSLQVHKSNWHTFLYPTCFCWKNWKMSLWCWVNLTDSRFRAGEASEHTESQTLLLSHYPDSESGKKIRQLDENKRFKLNNEGQTTAKEQKKTFLTDEWCGWRSWRDHWRGSRQRGGNQHLPVLNGNINNQFQLEGLYSFIDFMQK